MNEQRRDFVTQISGDEANTVSSVINEGGRQEEWGDMTVYINEYSSGDEEVVYKFLYNEMVVKINAPSNIESSEIRSIVEKLSGINPDSYNNLE